MPRIVALALVAGLAVAAFNPLAAPPAQASDAMAGDLMLSHATARPNLPNRPTAAYVTIANSGAASDRLLAASAPDFEAVELHTVIKDGDVMKMQPVEAIDVPAGETVKLAPGGFHLMLFGARKMFMPGDTMPLTLRFEKAGEVSLEAMVEKIDPSQMGHGQMQHGKISN